MKNIFASFLAVIMLVSLVGCASASKPESIVTKFCDALKTFDMETASSCFVSEILDIGITYTKENAKEQDIFTEQAIKYLTNCAKKMTYVLGETTTEGDKAVVPITFTYVDASPVMSAAWRDYITQAFALSGADDSVLEDLFGTIFVEKIESVSAETATATVEFVCIKQNDEWKIQELSDDAQYEIGNIISCNIVKALKSFGDEFSENNSENSEPVEEYVWYEIPAGQVLELETIKIAITGCEEVDKLTAKYYNPDIAQEGTKFVVLTVEIENITKSTLNFRNDFYLYDSQDREYQPYRDALWYFDETFSYTELAPNIKKTGTFVYHVPADAQGYYLTAAKSGTNEAYCLYVQSDMSEDSSKSFAAEGIQITLNEDFEQAEVDGFSLMCESHYMAVIVLREAFEDYEGLEEWSLADYSQVLMENNDYVDHPLSYHNGIPYFEYDYHNPETKENFHYTIFMYKSDDAFWAVQFATHKSAADRYAEKIKGFAESVQFAE